MPQRGRIVGIDVAKLKVDACIRALGARLTTPSTPEGRRELVAWLRGHRVRTAVMEASGGYEREWAEALRAASIEVRVVDPKRVRDFAKSAGRRAKNDPIDAEMIAWFGETFAAAPAAEHEPERDELARLVIARMALGEVSTKLCNWAEHRQPRVVQQAHAAIAKTVKRQLARLEASIAAKLKTTPQFVEPAQIIESVPGLATQTAAGMIAMLPELGTVGRRPVAALLGTAPYDADSGEHKGERHIAGGRRALRNLLYMATMGAATRHNPVLKEFYLRLRAKGKPAKVAIIACMRKLISIVNTMLAKRERWNPPMRAAATAA